jgi:hypothetical protein
VLAPVALSLAVAAASSITTFQTPSHHVGCAYTTAPAALRCDVVDATSKPPRRPKSCELDYGSAFGLTPSNRARRLCVGDTVLDPKAKVIAYGKTKHYGPFTCTARTSGLRCVNAAHHGFVLSRQAQKLF